METLIFKTSGFIINKFSAKAVYFVRNRNTSHYLAKIDFFPYYRIYNDNALPIVLKYQEQN